MTPRRVRARYATHVAEQYTDVRTPEGACTGDGPECHGTIHVHVADGRRVVPIYIGHWVIRCMGTATFAVMDAEMFSHYYEEETEP